MSFLDKLKEKVKGFRKPKPNPLLASLPKWLKDPENFDKVKYHKDFWLTMPSLIKAEDLKFTPVIYVTARAIPSIVTHLWLHGNGFPFAPVVSVGCGGSKVRALKGMVDYFIDDAVHNYKELNESGINCVLLSCSHNLDIEVEKRIETINEILEYEHSNN